MNDLMALEQQVGTTTMPIDVGREGQISLFGVLWRSTSDFPISKGEKARVLKRHGLTLIVEPVKSASAATLMLG